MLSMYLYLRETLESDEKKSLTVYWILSILTPVVDLFSISMLFPIINHAVSMSMALRELTWISLGMAVLVIFKGIFELYKNRILNLLVYGGAQKLSVKQYEVLMKEGLLKHNARGTAESLTTIRSDSVECMELLAASVDIVCSGLMMLFFSMALTVMTGFIGLLGCCGLFLNMFAVYTYYKKNISLYGREKRESDIRLNAQITVAYGVFKELKLDERWRTVMKRYEKYSKKSAWLQQEYTYKNRIAGIFLNNSIQAVFFCLLGLCIGFKIEVMSILAQIVVCVSILVRMLSIGNRMINGLHRIEFGKKAYQSLHDNMEEFKCIKEMEKSREVQRVKKVTLEKRLQVKNLTFAYREGENIFEDMSVDLPIGKAIAVIGPSGAGKSTFLDLMLGLLTPQKGNIYYDDYDIVTETDEQGKCRGNLGHIISYIPQTIYLNGETVKNNVGFFDENIDEQRVRKALEISHVLADVEKLPDGIDSLIGEAGSVLSGGQRQRIALARALYKDFELLVMDEAMASLDMDTEKAVIDSIRQVERNKTILLVTHHMSLARECDLIYKIEGKKLVKV
ncbi:MAG: ABC transporter ATP-binding protein [Hungatella sp.]|nr:ABC transporter ATP-binding protein [Hungatella sp.]